jgi:hypothetical protein
MKEELGVTDDLFELFRSVQSEVNANKHLLHLGRYCNTELLLQCTDHGDDQSVHLLIEHGRITEVIRGPLRMRAWQFALRAESSSWRMFWQSAPAVGFNDIFAMSRYGHLSIDGDVGPLLEHLRYIKELLALPRQLASEQHQVTA